MTTIVGPDGKWSFVDVPLRILPFDKDKPATDTNENKLLVGCDATGQVTAPRTVRRIEPIQLVWPFGTTVEDIYLPNPTLGKMTSFSDDDWHRISDLMKHYALDISTGQLPGRAPCFPGGVLPPFPPGAASSIGSN